MDKKDLKKLREIYAKIPEINCKGLCSDYCGAIGMQRGEFQEIERIAGRAPGLNPLTLTCTFLDENNQCSVYEIRPLVCRTWGTVENVLCRHGCAPSDGRFLTAAALLELFAEVRAVAGEEVKYNCSDELFEREKEMWASNKFQQLRKRILVRQ
jgi:Fe-S-cluster containining protein